jgi:NDP-sugar pyrophosphorylase family protein
VSPVPGRSRDAAPAPPLSHACLILAGGLGTRVRSLDAERPKTLLDVAGRPFADWQLSWLAAQGVRRVVYSIGYRGELVRAFVGDGRAWGLSVAYVEEGDRLLGTGGATRLAVAQGAVDGPFLLLYGDSYLQLDLAKVVRHRLRSGLPTLMTVLENHDRWGASNVAIDGGWVVAYGPGEGQRRVHIDYGLSILDADLVAELLVPAVRCDLAELFVPLIRRRLLGAYEVTERFYEIGSAAGRAELEAFVSGPGSEPHFEVTDRRAGPGP